MRFFSLLSKPNVGHLEAEEIITLFGLSAQELSEAGVAYENLKALEHFMD
ncbi:hypothetical protein tpqmel_0936 [Candidatus Gastranaerophilus sp. (ex Termes propinquus)]|nr:hypothetical protein tpqmel_0936 [Candidatus Gastranaerophilus sp. (ex Termes propinquus)]